MGRYEGIHLIRRRRRPSHRSASPGAGSLNGLTVYVPPAYTRQGLANLLDPDAAQKLNEADVILGVVGAGLTEACQNELNAGIIHHKHMIVMSQPAFVPLLEPSFGPNLVRTDPANPDKAEFGIVQYLKNIDAQQNAKTALLALGTLALGLLILAPAD